MGIITVTKTKIEPCVKNGVRLHWSSKKIAEVLGVLGFGDLEIARAMKEEGLI